MIASGPVDVVVAAAGSGRRLGLEHPKAFVEVQGSPIVGRALQTALALPARHIVVAVPADSPGRWSEAVEGLGFGSSIECVAGGASRQASVHLALRALREGARRRREPDPSLVLVHDAARPRATLDLWRRVAEAAGDTGAAIPVLPSTDSLKRLDDRGAVVGSVDRREVVRAQTPQGFRFDWLLEAHEAEAGGARATDDAALLERLGRPVASVAGEPGNIKLTTAEDLAALEGRVVGPAPFRVGHGYDIHPLVEGRPLVLGGVRIDSDRGLDGHSDADALAHAVIDALLGAAGLGDIGRKFPADDERWRGADSLELLAGVVDELAAAGYRPLNVDATVLAERPRLLPHLEQMRSRLAKPLRLASGAVNVKATRGEGLGTIGRGEGIAAHAVVTVGRG